MLISSGIMCWCTRTRPTTLERLGEGLGHRGGAKSRNSTPVVRFRGRHEGIKGAGDQRPRLFLYVNSQLLWTNPCVLRTMTPEPLSPKKGELQWATAAASSCP